MTAILDEERPKILVVDDIEQNHLIVGETLSHFFPCDLSFAYNGEQALVSARDVQPDVMLLDVMMPGMSGIEVCQKLKTMPETKDIPVLFLTAKTAASDIVEGFQAGAVDYVTKPFNSHELVARVRLQVNIRKASRIIHAQTVELEDRLRRLKESEHFLRTVIQSLPNPFAVMNADTYVIEMANEAYGGAAAVGRTCYSISHHQETPCTDSEHPCPLNEVKRSRQPAMAEHVHYNEEGKPQFIEVHISPVLNDDGRVVRIVESMLDVSERKQAEAHQRQQEKAESLGRMAGAVAHHYNNMMAVVMGNLELASMEAADNDVLTEELNEATTAARRASEMGRQMLTYLGETSATREPLDLCAPMRQWITEWRNTLPDTISFDAQAPDGVLPVCFNAEQIQRTCGALIRNSVEAMEKSSGTLSVRVFQESGLEIPSTHRFPTGFVPGSAQYACVEVKDSGCGIGRDQIRDVFDPFYTTKFAGRGLDLALALSAVRNHEGCITVKSEEDKGSEFRLYLPVTPDAPNRAE